jgi:hypothetical protein
VLNRCLLLARGKVLVGLHPLQQGLLAVTNGAADLDKRRAIAAHACLGQPRDAHLQHVSRFPRRKQGHDAGRRFLLAPAN